MALRQQTKAVNAQDPAPSSSPWLLEAIQQPRQARMCGSGDKADRRPLDPPPILRLRIRKAAVATSTATAPRKRKGAAQPAADEDQFVSPTLTHTLFCFASLVGEEDDEEVYMLSGSRTKHVTGSVVSSLFHLKDQSCFVFPDLSVRTEGRWRFKMTMYEIVDDGVNYCTSVFTDPFTVYSSKRFPGMSQSTELSKAFAQQGLRLRIRRPGPAGAKDDDYDEELTSAIRGTTKAPRRKRASTAQSAPVRFSGPRPHNSPSSSFHDLPAEEAWDGARTRNPLSRVGERSISPPPAPEVARAVPRKRSQEEAALAHAPVEESRRTLPPIWTGASTKFTSVVPPKNPPRQRQEPPPAFARPPRLDTRPVPSTDIHSQHSRPRQQSPPHAPPHRSEPRYPPTSTNGQRRHPTFDVPIAELSSTRSPLPYPRISNAPPIFHYYQPKGPGTYSTGPRLPPLSPPLGSSRPGPSPSVLAPIYTETREYPSHPSPALSRSTSYPRAYESPRSAHAPPHPAAAFSATSRSPEELASWDRERQRYQSQHRRSGSESGYEHGAPAYHHDERRRRRRSISVGGAQASDRLEREPQPMEGVEQQPPALVEGRRPSIAELSGGASLDKLLGSSDAKDLAAPDEPFFF